MRVGIKELSIVLVCTAGMGLYPLLLFASGGVTMAEAKGMLRRRRGDPPPMELP
jgi:putative peptidoglycan lipid II flippase